MSYYDYCIITKNAAKCRKCSSVIESKHRHDFVTCSCGEISVDGGYDYLKRCGSFDSFEELSESRQMTVEELQKILKSHEGSRTNYSERVIVEINEILKQRELK